MRAKMSNQISSAIKKFADGDFVIVTDDADRENEGDLFLLASAATAEKNWLYDPLHIWRDLRCYD